MTVAENTLLRIFLSYGKDFDLLILCFSWESVLKTSLLYKNHQIIKCDKCNVDEVTFYLSVFSLLTDDKK